MAHFLVQVSYTPEAWAAMTKNPQNREDAIRPVVEQMGGKLEAFYLSFGDYDVVAIASFPSNVDAASFAIGASAAGAIKAFKTTPLLSPNEAVDAMRSAGNLGYQPPG